MASVSEAAYSNQEYPFERELSEEAKIGLHLGFSACVSYGSCWALDRIFPRTSLASTCAAGTGIGMIPGIAKECYDKYIRGYRFMWNDMLINFAGCAAGSTAYFFLHGKKKVALAIGLNTITLSCKIYPLGPAAGGMPPPW